MRVAGELPVADAPGEPEVVVYLDQQLRELELPHVRLKPFLEACQVGGLFVRQPIGRVGRQVSAILVDLRVGVVGSSGEEATKASPSRRSKYAGTSSAAAGSFDREKKPARTLSTARRA